ncbi:MAG: hypothetical protein ABIB11_04265, partial [Candidatus Omnitrophota bacterium]
LIALICLISSSVIGCAEITPPGPETILAPWKGVSPVRLGESKDAVLDKWGEPNNITILGSDDVGLVKEEWVYYGKYPSVFIDYQYLSKTKHLIFTGNSLTGYYVSDPKKDSEKTGSSENNK